MEEGRDFLNKEAINLKILISSILDAFSFGIIIFDKDLTILEANKAAIEAIGLEKSEILGKKLPKIETAYHLELKEAINRLVNFVFSDEIVNLEEVLSILGKTAKVSRAYIFIFQEGKIKNIIEWCASGVFPHQNLQGIEIVNFTWFMEKLEKNKNIIISDVSELPQEAIKEKELFETQGVRSVLIVPIFLEQELFGFVGFDDTEKSRKWSEEDIYLLDTAAKAFAVYFKLTRLKEDLSETQRLYQTLTEQHHLRDWLLLSQKMEAVSRLARGIAYGFNNLLTVIGGYSELLLNFLPATSPLHKYILEIKNATQKANNFINQLLIISGKKIIIEVKIINLNEFILEIEKELQYLVGEGIEIKTNLTPELWFVEIDPFHFKQVILNLVKNAKEAMPKGGRIFIETANIVLEENYVPPDLGWESGEYVLLAISDTGCGMTEEIKEHIFEPFFTTKKDQPEAGLGLSIVYNIVKQHKGHITVYSEVGQGTTFKIYLPRVKEKEISKEDLEKTSSKPKTVLLVEDEKAVREIIKEFLEICGYQVLEAQDGEEAISISQSYKETIHLLFTDVIMPGMDGKTVADRIKALRPDIRVLYMSGHPESIVASYGIEVKKANFIQKPFSISDLAKKIKEILEEET